MFLGIGVQRFRLRSIECPGNLPPFDRFASVMAHPIVITTALISALNQYVIWATTFGFIPLYADGLGATKSTLGIIGRDCLCWRLHSCVVGQSPRCRPFGRKCVHCFVGISVMAANAAFVVPLINSLPFLAITQGISGVGLAAWTYHGVADGTEHSADTHEQDRATAMGVFQRHRMAYRL